MQHFLLSVTIYFLLQLAVAMVEVEGWYLPRFGGGPESGYLAGSVGRALQVAMAEVAEKRPQDPIEYLAVCLHKYSSNLHRTQQVSQIR